MSGDRRRPNGAVDVASLAEFAKGWRQQGLQRTIAAAGPFAIVAVAKRARGGR